MAKRGPRKTGRPEHIADEVTAMLWKEQARVKWGLAKAKGQQKIGTPLIKGVCEKVGQEYGMTARTVETYYHRHGGPGSTARYAAEITARLSGKRVRTVSQSEGKVLRRK